MSALKELFSAIHVAEFWEFNRSRFSRRTTPGVDLVTRDQFNESFRAEARLASERIVSGNYEFQSLRPIPIPKAGGAPRIINVPTIRDRLVQRMLVDFLVKKYGRDWRLPNSFSSMGGEDEGVQRTLNRIASRIRPESFVVKADLSKYFDTIARAELMKCIRGLVRDRSLWSIIEKAISSETNLKEREFRDLVTKGELKKGVGVRQGMPISPLVAFLFLRDVDGEMPLSSFYRYVDDMVFIAESKHEAVALFEHYKQAAESRGLKIHPLGSTKTQLVAPRESFEFLGIKLDRTGSTISFKIPPQSKEEIRKRALARCSIDKMDKKAQRGWLLSNASRASQLAKSYEGAYGACVDWPAFRDELRKLQLTMCKRIADELYQVKQFDKDYEMLRRLFGF